MAVGNGNGEPCPQVRFFCEADQNLAACFASEAAVASGAKIRWYWLDSEKNLDPLYDEPDPLYGDIPATPDHLVGEGAWAYVGPFEMFAAFEYVQWDGGEQANPNVRDEGLHVQGDATVRLMRTEMNRVKMIDDADADADQYLPKEGDVMAVWFDGTNHNDSGPKYFSAVDVNPDGHLGSGGKWNMIWITLRSLSEFNPGRQPGLVDSPDNLVTIL